MCSINCVPLSPTARGSAHGLMFDTHCVNTQWHRLREKRRNSQPSEWHSVTEDEGCRRKTHLQVYEKKERGSGTQERAVKCEYAEILTKEPQRRGHKRRLLITHVLL